MNTEQKNPPETPFEAKAGITFVCTEVEIVANRLLLRPISKADAKKIYQNFSHEVTRYMVPKPPDHIEETLEFIRRSRDDMKQGNNLQFVITDKVSGAFLGLCALHGQGKPKTPELGIWLKVAAQGNGYGKEAIFALKQWADHHLNYDHLTYPVDRANLPSRRIPEALGGEIIEEEQCPTQDGRILNIVVYRILPSRENET